MRLDMTETAADAALRAHPASDLTKPVARPIHTIILIVVMLAIAVRGAMLKHAGAGATARTPRLTVYLGVVASELILVLAVSRGIRRGGLTLGGLVNAPSSPPRALLTDVLLGFTCWGGILVVSAWWKRVIPSAGSSALVTSLLPGTLIERAAWLAVSATAGFAEELVFRGYFQRQFTAWTRTVSGGIVCQAVVFGVAHGYQGWAACAEIMLIGLIFGALAWWRRTLRPGIIAHAWTDIAGGLFHF